MSNEFIHGKHLELLLIWLNNKFPKTLLMIGDYLNRYNEVIQTRCIKSLENPVDSMKEGGEIYTKITAIISDLELVNIQVFRWKKFLDIEHVKQSKIIFQSNIEKNIKFRECVYADIYKYFKRNHLTPLIDEINYSFQYIAEELAVMDYIVSTGYKVQAYPGTQLSVMKMFSKGHFNNIKTNLRTCTYIDLGVRKLKRRKVNV